MTDLDSRLTRCFASVFRKLPANEIPHATVESVRGWDSIATATLMGVISDEFSLPLDFDDVDQLTSYHGVRAWVLARIGQ